MFCIIKGGVKKFLLKLFEYCCFKSYNKEVFLCDFSNLFWSIIESVNDVDDVVFFWEGFFNSIVNDYVLIKLKCVKGIKILWVMNKFFEIWSD